MRQKTVNKKNWTTQIERIVMDIDKASSVLNTIVLDLYNFDPQTLSENTDEVYIDLKDYEKIKTVKVDKAIIPVLYAYEQDDLLYNIWMGLLCIKQDNISYVKWRDKIYLHSKGLFIPISPPTVNTMILLIINRSSQKLVDTTLSFLGETRESFTDMEKRATLTTQELIKDLIHRRENPNYFISLADGYKSGIFIDNTIEKVSATFTYYYIADDIWAYYGVNGLFVSEAKQIPYMLEKQGISIEKYIKTYERVKHIINDIEKLIAKAYIMTKIYKNLTSKQ